MGIVKTSRANDDRLDRVLVKRGLINSRQRAQALIMEGRVRVDGKRVDKSGTKIAADAELVINGEESPYVSRGGEKLEKALDQWQIEIKGKTFMDVGASTGGFTDCLLKRGAARVYAVDVGYGQLAWKIRCDERVVNLERCNIRYFSKEGCKDELDGAVVDVSFISLKKVIPKVMELIKMGGDMIALIKPQFEVGKSEVGKGGVVRDAKKHKAVIDDISAFAIRQHLQVVGVLASPLLGPKGNKEFFIYLRT